MFLRIFSQARSPKRGRLLSLNSFKYPSWGNNDNLPYFSIKRATVWFPADVLTALPLTFPLLDSEKNLVILLVVVRFRSLIKEVVLQYLGYWVFWCFNCLFLRAFKFWEAYLSFTHVIVRAFTKFVVIRNCLRRKNSCFDHGTKTRFILKVGLTTRQW